MPVTCNGSLRRAHAVMYRCCERSDVFYLAADNMLPIVLFFNHETASIPPTKRWSSRPGCARSGRFSTMHSSRSFTSATILEPEYAAVCSTAVGAPDTPRVSIFYDTADLGPRCIALPAHLLDEWRHSEAKSPCAFLFLICEASLTTKTGSRQG